MIFELDEDGYPTSETIDNILMWDDSPSELFRSICDLFPPYGRFERRDTDGVWEVATGGWSGCEEIVEAMMNNIFISHSWLMSKRGGYHEFEDINQF